MAFKGKNPFKLLRPLLIEGGVRVATMTGNETWTRANSQVNFLDPGGAGRTITLEAEEKCDGLVIFVGNTADNPETLTVNNDAGSLVLAVAQGEIAVFGCDGSTWDALGALNASSLDLNGSADAFILDADGDTTISAPTDDQIDFEIGGADDFVMVANIFRALSGSSIETNTINETTAGSGVTIDGVLIKDTTIDLNGTAGALILDADADTHIGASTDDQIDVTISGAIDFRMTANTFSVLSGSALELADGSLLRMVGAGTGTGDVVQRIGGTATEGLELKVYDATVSPAAVETNLINVPAGSVIVSVQGNVEAALTGGGTTVTWSIGTTGDPDKYGTAGYPVQADALTQNSKSDWMGTWAYLTSSEQMVLTGTATGGAADGDTALTVGSVRVRVVYYTMNSLDDAA